MPKDKFARIINRLEKVKSLKYSRDLKRITAPPTTFEIPSRDSKIKIYMMVRIGIVRYKEVGIGFLIRKNGGFNKYVNFEQAFKIMSPEAQKDLIFCLDLFL